jgi:hypothetical protein
MTAWEWIKLTLASPYTLLSAVIANLAMNAAAFGYRSGYGAAPAHRGDVQEEPPLTDHRRGDGPADLRDVHVIGILLIAYYQLDPRYKPTSNADMLGRTSST